MTEPTSATRPELTAAHWNRRSRERLPGMVGVEVTEVGSGFMAGRVDIRPELWAPNGFLHAATVIALADTLCGYGCTVAWPEGATGFTTVETKTNHLGTVRDGAISCRATLVHGGRTTQVWDATVSDEATGKPIALYRCTQMLLYPK